jgi:hypothetical protein
VLRTGAVGILEDDIGYHENNPFANYITILTLLAQYAQMVQFTRLGQTALTGTQFATYIRSDPATPSLPYQNYFENGVRTSKFTVYNVSDFV